MDEDFKKILTHMTGLRQECLIYRERQSGIIGLEVKYEDVLKRNKWEDTDGYRCQRNRVEGCGIIGLNRLPEIH